MDIDGVMVVDRTQWTLLIHAAATLCMVGIIWFVQVCHYPLYASVGREGFAAYEQAHNRLTTWVVGPLMLVELATALLLFRHGGPDLYLWAWCGIALLALIWASTFFLQVPEHNRLIGGFDPDAHLRLVRTNWIRTVAWTGRGLLCLYLLGAHHPAQA